MKYWPSTSPASNVWTMFGCDRPAATRASWTNMAMNVGSALFAGRIRLSTTSFSNPLGERWSARNSSAIPPDDRRERSVYGPNCAGSPSSPETPRTGLFMGGAHHATSYDIYI
jgi:hypothetical protein